MLHNEHTHTQFHTLAPAYYLDVITGVMGVNCMGKKKLTVVHVNSGCAAVTLTLRLRCRWSRSHRGWGWVGSALASFSSACSAREAGWRSEQRDAAETCRKHGTVSHGRSQVPRLGLTAGDTRRRSHEPELLIFFLMGGCEWCGRWNVTKIFTFAFRTAWLWGWDSAPSAGAG